MPVLSLRGDPLGGIAAGDGGGVDPRRPPPIWACCPVMHSLHPGFCCHIKHIYAMITELWPPVIQALHSNISTLVRGPCPAAVLLQAAVVVFDSPGLEGQLLAAGRGQVQIAAGPVCRAAVVGHGPAYAYKAIAPQMHLPPLRRDLEVADRHVAAAVGIDLAVGLEPGKPSPPQLAQMLQIVQTTVPTITKHVLGLQAAGVRGRNHIAQVFVLGFAAHGLVIHAEVAGDPGCTFSPEQRNQVDALHHARPEGTRLATPVPGHPLDLPRIGLVQSGVVHHQDPPLARDQLWGLLPQVGGVGGLALPQAGEGIVGRCLLCLGLTPGRFRARIAGR